MASSTVAFQGNPGAFSELAAQEFFKEPSVALDGSAENKTAAGSIKTIPKSTFKDVFQAVSNGESQYGIVPIENSESGAFRTVYDLLGSNKLFIVGEVAPQEEHCVCVLPGVKIEDVREVCSHPSIFPQCERYISAVEKKIGQSLHLHGTSDTAGSCKLLKDKDMRQSAAIASRQAAKAFGLDILEAGVAQDGHIATRYVILSKTPAKLHTFSNVKGSLALTIRNEPGSMFRVLACFALRKINVIKLEVRPTSTSANASEAFQARTHWEYQFYLDYEPTSTAAAAGPGGDGWSQDTNVALLANLREFCLHVQELGFYRQNLPKRAAATPQWEQHLHSSAYL